LIQPPRSIEDNVRLTCSDLVQNCVVVGSYKPIVLFVEPTPSFVDNVDNPTELKTKILKRIQAYQAGLFAHERVDDRVVVVLPGSLPRTDKGNIK
jgi:hypothetical protein